MNVEKAPDVQEMVERIVEVLSYDYIIDARILCMRSYNSKANAYARIWNLPDIWQKALDVKAFYIVEVISQHFDPLPEEEKEKIIIHELAHIPKTFSGALRPHKYHGGRVDDKTVNKLYKEYKKRLTERVEFLE